ncbi:MAG: SDR family NAD(P)-dependent oxidoreductase [Pseudomonadota bacterium]
MLETPFRGKTWWLVGASEGLGRSLAFKMNKAGAKLILSARSADRLKALAEELGGEHQVAPCDVTDLKAVEETAASLGPYHGVLYNAGAYDPIHASEWDSAAVAKMNAVNYLGVCHVLGEAVPRLVEQGKGRVVIIGSLAGFRGLPSAIGYGASKAAAMHLAENLKTDLRGTGVHVQRINPGFIKTRLTDKNDFAMAQIMTPDDAADRVMQAIRSGRFSTSFPAPFAWVFTVGRYLPLGLFHRITG